MARGISGLSPSWGLFSLGSVFVLYFFFAMLGIELRALCVVGPVLRDSDFPNYDSTLSLE
jgi:hypothetical protein